MESLYPVGNSEPLKILELGHNNTLERSIWVRVFQAEETEYSAGLRKNEQPVWLDLSQSKEDKRKKLVQKGNYYNPCFVTNAKDGVR